MRCYSGFGILTVLFFQIASASVFDQFFPNEIPCEEPCEDMFWGPLSELKRSCSEGCRLFTIIGLAKGFNNNTQSLCVSACSEAFSNSSLAGACNYGCQQNYKAKKEEDIQTLHLLTPLLYIKSAYNSMAHHVRQFISTSWTVYVQEDSGKMVVLQTNPQIVESSEYSVSPDNNQMRNSQSSWEEEKLDWMDCISHQSGLPRWLLVIVLFGFILALLWLCCATAVTAPNQYMSASKQKKNVGYLLVCEPSIDMKLPPTLINCDEEAPPLPPKSSLI